MQRLACLLHNGCTAQYSIVDMYMNHLRFCMLFTDVTQVIRTLRKDDKPVVIDADGLHILKHNLDLLKVC